MSMITIRKELHRDVAAREALLDRCFGDTRFQKAAERLREGRLPAHGLAFVASDRGRVVGTVRLWNVSAGPSRPALLLGPVAVQADLAKMDDVRRLFADVKQRFEAEHGPLPAPPPAAQ